VTRGSVETLYRPSLSEGVSMTLWASIMDENDRLKADN
jgi:hypothetical protein